MNAAGINAFRLIAAGGLAALAMPAAQAGSDAGDPARNWEAIARCAGQESASARHTCMDEVLRQAGLLDPARELAEQREAFGQSGRKEKPQAEAEEAAESLAPTRIEQIETTIAYAKFAQSGKLLVVTEEGAVWRQTSTETIRFAPKPGTAFAVSKVSLGGYRCKIGSSTLYRCERLD